MSSQTAKRAEGAFPMTMMAPSTRSSRARNPAAVLVDPSRAGRIPCVQGAEDGALVPRLQDPGLDHPDIGDDRGAAPEGIEACPDRVVPEPEEVRHGEIADGDGAPLPDAVLGRPVADGCAGDGPALP